MDPQKLLHAFQQAQVELSKVAPLNKELNSQALGRNEDRIFKFATKIAHALETGDLVQIAAECGTIFKDQATALQVGWPALEKMRKAAALKALGYSDQETLFLMENEVKKAPSLTHRPPHSFRPSNEARKEAGKDARPLPSTKKK
jgi:hypothetical protein